MTNQDASHFLFGRRYPKTSFEYCQSRPDSATYHTSRHGHAVSIANGMLYQDGPMHLFFTSEGQWLEDLSHFSADGASKNQHPETFCVKGTVAVFASFWSGAFYHWLYNSLPRMKIMRDFAMLEEVDWFLVDAYHVPAIAEMMKLLELPEDRIVRLPKTRPAILRADRLIASNLPVRPSRFSCDCLVELAQHVIQPSQTKGRIFIGRRDAAFRNIVNYDSVFRPLQKLGFIEAELSELPYEDQINLFASAECIVAVHGAGLCFLPFCEAGTTVIELFPPDYLPDMYEEISAMCNLNYRSVKGRRVPGTEGVRPSFLNLEVEPKLVLETLLSAISSAD